MFGNDVFHLHCQVEVKEEKGWDSTKGACMNTTTPASIKIRTGMDFEKCFISIADE